MDTIDIWEEFASPYHAILEQPEQPLDDFDGDMSGRLTFEVDSNGKIYITTEWSDDSDETNVLISNLMYHLHTGNIGKMHIDALLKQSAMYPEMSEFIETSLQYMGSLKLNDKDTVSADGPLIKPTSVFQYKK